MPRFSFVLSSVERMNAWGSCALRSCREDHRHREATLRAPAVQAHALPAGPALSLRPWVLLWFAFMLGACGKSCGERPLAELLEARGEVTRDYRGSELQWAPAQVGSAFSFGDALRTAKGSLAEVRVGKSGRVRVDSETIVRFLDHVAPSGEPSSELQVTQGSATVEATEAQLTLRTRTGTALLEPGTKVLLQPAEQVDTYRVLVGSATFHQADGQAIEVQAGHSIAIGIGLAVLDDDPSNPLGALAAQPSAASAAQIDQGALHPGDAGVVRADADVGAVDPLAVDVEPDTELADAAVARQAQASSELQQESAHGPATHASADHDDNDHKPQRRAELSVAAGESFEVYDPAPPTLIGISVPRACRHGAQLRLRGGRSVRADDVLLLKLAKGSHRYNVYCLKGSRRGRKVASGRIRVRRASGTRALPKTAPRNSVELDGHRYRLIYQNLRPVIDVSWPAAPRASSYTLTLERPGRTAATFETDKPSFVLPSSALRDGKHTLVMRARSAGAGAASKATTLHIALDNAAPTASLELPKVAGFAAARPINVRGTAAEGTAVSVEGKRVKVSPRGTFSHKLTLPAGRSALSVRFQHRKHGVRYYIRRARGLRR